MYFLEALSILKDSAKNIKKQDNRITADPVFTVEVKRRVYGLHWSHTTKFVWVSEDSDDVYEDDSLKYKEIDDLCEAIGEAPDGWEKQGVEEHHEAIQWFFTEAEAAFFIVNNRHNLEDPRINIVSGYLNNEWQAVRILLQSNIFQACLTAQRAEANHDLG